MFGKQHNNNYLDMIDRLCVVGFMQSDCFAQSLGQILLRPKLIPVRPMLVKRSYWCSNIFDHMAMTTVVYYCCTLD